MIEIDASAGGQVLRTTIGLSALLGKEVTVLNIRKNRPKPGIFPQHLAGIKAMGVLCGATVHGAFNGSTKIVFSPKEFVGTHLNVNIGTAGSTMLLLSELLPACFLEETMLRISGGTDVPFAPSFNYFREVFLYTLSRFNAKTELSLLSYGFYPKGGGAVSFKSHKIKKLKPINILSCGKLSLIKIFSHSSQIPSSVAKAQAVSARKMIGHLGVEVVEQIDAAQNAGTIGSAIDLVACFDNGVCIGANALGAKGKRAEIVGAEAAQRLLLELGSGAAVDSHMSDQLLPFMALAKGKSAILCANETGHAKSNIQVLEKMLEVEFVKEQKGNLLEISVQGAGFF